MGSFVGKREVSESNEAQNNGLTTASSATFPLPADSSVGGRIVGSRPGFLSKKLKKKGLCTGNHIFWRIKIVLLLVALATIQFVTSELNKSDPKSCWIVFQYICVCNFFSGGKLSSEGNVNYFAHGLFIFFFFWISNLTLQTKIFTDGIHFYFLAQGQRWPFNS